MAGTSARAPLPAALASVSAASTSAGSLLFSFSVSAGTFTVTGGAPFFGRAEGALVFREEIELGLDQAPAALAELFRGENRGKKIIQIVDGAQPL